MDDPLLHCFLDLVTSNQALSLILHFFISEEGTIKVSTF